MAGLAAFFASPLARSRAILGLYLVMIGDAWAHGRSGLARLIMPHSKHLIQVNQVPLHDRLARAHFDPRRDIRSISAVRSRLQIRNVSRPLAARAECVTVKQWVRDVGLRLPRGLQLVHRLPGSRCD